MAFFPCDSFFTMNFILLQWDQNAFNLYIDVGMILQDEMFSL